MILPPELIEMIVKIMINNRQFDDLKKMRQIPKLSSLVFNSKKYGALRNIVRKMDNDLCFTFQRFMKLQIGQNEFENFWERITENNTRLPYILNEERVAETQPGEFISGRIKKTGDKLVKFIISGIGINKIEIFIDGRIIFTYWFNNGSLINLRLLDDGIRLFSMFWSTVQIKVYAKSVNFMYTKCLFMNIDIINPMRRNPYVSKCKYYTSHKFRTIRENYLMYSDGMCIPRYSL